MTDRNSSFENAAPTTAENHGRLQNNLWRPAFLVSTAMAFALAFYGYYSFAGLVNAFMPASNIGAIIIRLLILISLSIALITRRRQRLALKSELFVPSCLFFFLYICRIFENIYVQDIEIPPGPLLIFSIFIFSGIVPAYVLSVCYRDIRDEDLISSISLLCLIFLVGMSLNMSALVASADQRLMIDKINPISMAHTATAFLLYYLISFRKSKRLMLEAIVASPVLLIIIVYARSRGAYIAGAGAVVIYILLQRGPRKIWVALAALIGFLSLVYADGGKYFEIIMEALGRIDIERDPSSIGHYTAFQGAWQQFVDNFLVGRYAVEMVTGYYPHNIYLEALMSVGFLGSVPFMIHLFMATRAAIGIVGSHTSRVAPMLVSLLYFRDAIASMTSGSLWGNTGFWITSMLAILYWYGPRVKGPYVKQYTTRPVTKQYNDIP